VGNGIALGKAPEPVVSQDVKPNTSLGKESPRIKDETPQLEVRESRGVSTPNRDPYTRKVLDACKAKFGTPKATEVNYRAVWRYAHGVMKDHGVRPSHIQSMLPYVVELTFVPSHDELRAKVVCGSYKALLEDRFDEHLSRAHCWMRWCARGMGW